MGLLGTLSTLQVCGWMGGSDRMTCQQRLTRRAEGHGWGLRVPPSCQEVAGGLCWWGCLGPGVGGGSCGPRPARSGRGQGRCRGGQRVGQLTIGVHVVTWHLGWREALLKGVATAIGTLLHGHDLLLWWGQWRVGGHHALHAT